MPLQVLAFPATLLIRFWQNHHLLDVMQRPVWRVVSGRSQAYVQRILAGAESGQPERHLCMLLNSPLSGNLAGIGSGLFKSLRRPTKGTPASRAPAWKALLWSEMACLEEPWVVLLEITSCLLAQAVAARNLSC